ncbi:hypothetical protein [Weissella confusa]|uniref:hypothetical protein n=1 Tax=Weissella confusa TaxID=1583 RepID=UPI0018988AAD|nr:hypothetical protein [Weissella confusa]
MSLFKTITDGMANAGTYIQQNFEKLAKAIVSIDDTTGEIELGDVKVNKLNVSGTVDSKQKIYTRTIGTTNDLKITYTRVGSLVTGRYVVKFAGTFPVGTNDGYKAPTEYPVNVIAGGGVDAYFTPDNKFVAKGASEGNFIYITSDPLPKN